GHLLVHGRWALPDRVVRSQAQVDGAGREGFAVLGPYGPADYHLHQWAGPPADGWTGLSVRDGAQDRDADLVVAATPGEGCWRNRHYPFDAHRTDQPRSGDNLYQLRQSATRPAAPGCLAFVC